jgi:DNA helicase-2/ATP-dependent DNA helicase PcrA
VNHSLFDCSKTQAVKPSVDHLAGLNEQQREAVTTTEGPILILAGAGSGKTKAITHRIAYLIEACGVRPENILAVTFTNKAAGEMKERVEKLLAGYYASGARTGSPLISTFHSLCVRILRREIEKLGQGYTRLFTVYDTDDQQQLLRACLKELGYEEDRRLSARAVQSAISRAKNRGEDPHSYAARAEYDDERHAAIARVFKLYEERLRSSNALDFDDLLIRTVQLLWHRAETCQYYHERFHHVMVDEFQDTNGIQYALTRLIVEGPEAIKSVRLPADFWTGRSLCVVGDEGQAIYGWRGSDFNIILGFEQDFPGTKVIKLEENYRSTKHILEAANRVIANNTQRFDKRLYAKAGEGEKLRYAMLPDGEAEAHWIAGRISDHLLREPGLRAAVLYRTNAQSRSFEEACRRAGLRYNLVGGFSFYERAEIKDIIAYLRLALNPHDSVALMRVINTPARGVGKTTIDYIERRAKDFGVSHWETISLIIEQNLLPARAISALQSFREIITRLIEKVRSEAGNLVEIVKAAITETGYERALRAENNEEAEARLLNLEELGNAAAEAMERGETLRNFLDHAALISDTDNYTAEAQVTLMTMHAAKGLEFPLVFIAGLEEGLFPLLRAREKKDELEEERRLCYVAITRAERYLYLTHAMRRRVYGEELPAEPSRFLKEVPLELIEDLSPGPSWLSLISRTSSFEDRALDSCWRELVCSSSGPGRSGSCESNSKGRRGNDVRSVREFFARQGKQLDEGLFDSRTIEYDEPSSSGLKPGMRVRHAKYGQGLILKREGEGENAKLTINFPGYGVKKIIEKFAGLEKV